MDKNNSVEANINRAGARHEAWIAAVSLRRRLLALVLGVVGFFWITAAAKISWVPFEVLGENLVAMVAAAPGILMIFAIFPVLFGAPSPDPAPEPPMTES